MRTKEQVLLSIKDSGMVAVVRGETSDKAMEIVEKCIEGGIKAIELTFTVPYAHRVIEDISRKYGDSIILGAGTVLDSETARIALLSGAEFIVSPHFNPEVTRLCNRYRKASMAGILTITEAVEAMGRPAWISSSCSPATCSGPAFIKDIRGPLPYAQIMPTGRRERRKCRRLDPGRRCGGGCRQQPDEGRCQGQCRTVYGEHPPAREA